MKPTPEQLAAGWIPFWRFFLDDDDWKMTPYSRTKLWQWIILEAAHKGNAHRYHLEPGQLKHSFDFIRRAMAWEDPVSHTTKEPSNSTLLRDLKALEEQGKIRRQIPKNQGRKGVTIISICEYSTLFELKGIPCNDNAYPVTHESPDKTSVYNEKQESPVTFRLGTGDALQGGSNPVTQANTVKTEGYSENPQSLVTQSVTDFNNSNNKTTPQPPPPRTRTPVKFGPPNQDQERQPVGQFEIDFAFYWTEYVTDFDPVPWRQLDLWRRTVGEPVVLASILHLATTGKTPEDPLSYLPSLFVSAKAGELSTQRSHPLCQEDPLYRVPGVSGNGRASGLESGPPGQPRSRLASEIMAEMMAEPDADRNCTCLNGWRKTDGHSEPCPDCERGRYHRDKRLKGASL